MEKLVVSLKDWSDAEDAMVHLAEFLGIVDFDKGSYQVDYKGIFSTKNKYSDYLYSVVLQLIEFGILEKNEDGDIRAVSGFDPNSKK